MAKNAVITGGGNGIGRETALLFLEEGFNVVVAGRHENTLQETLMLAGSAAERGLALTTDITDPATVKRVFAATLETFGRVDFLFNNACVAGIQAAGTPLTEISLDYRAHNIACGQIDIGNAGTEQTGRHLQGAMRGGGCIKKEALMSVKDEALALLFMANLPLDANVQHMTMLATKMPFIGRG